MSNKIVNQILSVKERQIRKLLSLTESPIEEIFLAYLIKYVEESLSTVLKFNIQGMSYLMDVDVDEDAFTVDESIAGITLVNAHTVYNLRVSPSEGRHFKMEKNDYTERDPKFLIDCGYDGRKTIMQILEIIPQYKVFVDGRNYRLDFAFMLYENYRHQKDLVKKVAIECDGHEYHSDKKVFTRDRERYRKLLSKNWVIFPFSGCEINNNSSDYYYKEFDKIFRVLRFGRYSLSSLPIEKDDDVWD